MSFGRNLALQRRSPMKLLLLFGFPVRLSSPGFVYLLIFKSMSKQVIYIYIYVKMLIWRTCSKQRSPPACACQGPYQVLATVCVHTLVVAGRNHGVVGHTWSQQPLLGLSLPWGLSPCPVMMLQSFVLVLALQPWNVYDGFKELKFVWHHRHGGES